MIDLAVFDMAGTTVSDKDYVAKAFEKAFWNHSIALSEKQINPLMGYPKPEAIQVLLRKQGIDDPQLLEKIHEDFASEMIDFYLYSPYVKPMAGAEDLFFYLKEKNVKVTLNTGFSRDIADVIVRRFRWLERGLVDDFIASDEVAAGRPFPLMIEALKSRNQITEEANVMKVGDTVVDILEGKNALCKYVVAVTTGSASRRELESYDPTHIIGNLSQIPAILNETIGSYV